MNAVGTIPLWNKTWFLWLVRLAAGLMLALLALGVYLNARPNIPQQSDFALLYASAASHQQGRGLYQHFIYAPILDRIFFLGTPDRPDGMRLMENLNPPVVSFLVYPFAAYDLRTAYYLWCAVQVALAILLLWRLLEALGWRHPLLRPVVVFIVAAYFPVLANLLLGQIGLFLLAPLVLMTLALLQGRERLAGCWLGAALLLKLFVGLIFIWFLLQRRWSILWYGALVWALGMFAALLVFGVQDHLNWIKVLQEYRAAMLSWNASLTGVAERYFGAVLTRVRYESPWASWALHSAGFIFAAIAALWLNRQSRVFNPQQLGLLGLALALPLMLMLAPLGWIYYFPVLLLSAALLWHVSEPLPRRTGIGAGIVGALMLSAMPQLLTGGNDMRWQWRRTYYQDSFIDTSGQDLVVHGEGAYHWFVAPEFYTAALFLLCLIVLRIAYRLRSTQMGA